MIDYVALLHWIVSLIMFIFPMVMFPFYFLNGSELANFMNAWYYVNILGDFWFFYNVIRFFVNLFIAIYSGRGN